MTNKIIGAAAKDLSVWVENPIIVKANSLIVLHNDTKMYIIQNDMYQWNKMIHYVYKMIPI